MLGRERLVIGGKSMGDSIASLVADEAGVAGLVCLGAGGWLSCSDQQP